MKALVIEDSKVVRSITSKMLDEMGFAVSEAENGLVGIEKVKKDTYEIIILDWNMPELDGMGFLKKARNDNLLADAKVILCTTENEKEKIEEAMNSGAHEYIMKPYTSEILEDKLKILGIL